jgi:hypothetical protein
MDKRIRTHFKQMAFFSKFEMNVDNINEPKNVQNNIFLKPFFQITNHDGVLFGGV